MNDQTIPAEKVRELKAKYEYDTSGNPERLLDDLLHDLDALLPVQQPTTGLLGRWAKHPEHGNVVCVAERPASGLVKIAFQDNCVLMSAKYATVALSDLTFPEQATKPEDVPAGEAWLVRDVDGREFNALKTSGTFPWRFFDGEEGGHDGHRNHAITLIAPLTPERPGKDDEGFLAENERILAAYSECAEALQARYDELDKSWCYLDGKYSTLREDYDALEAKYREAQEKIKTLEQPSTPRIVATEAEYAALPIGSMFVDADDDVWRKVLSGNWIQEVSYQMLSDAKLSGTTRTVLRYGWGDEQPVWRIEHNPDNLRVGEYIIDKDGDTGTVAYRFGSTEWATDGDARGTDDYAPFIVFPSKDAATPEAIEEAKQARDKEKTND